MKKIIFFISLTCLALSCRENETSEKKNESETNKVTLTNEQLKNADISTGHLSKKNLSSVLKLNGKIDVPPQNMVSVSVPMGGYLKYSKLLTGMHVNQGEIIAEIEDQQYIQLQQDYLTAKAQFSFNESEYKRQQELNQNKAISDKTFEQTKATYQTQLILIKALEQKLKLIGINPNELTANTISKSIHIYSPITGFVSAVNVNIGKYVNPSDVLFELINPSDIHVALTVFEKDVNKLSINQKVIAYTNTNPEQKYLCTIILISKSLEKNNATQVHCHFEQYDKNLLPGMFMNADVQLTNNQVMALPNEAIVRFENKQFAFISTGNNQFEKIEVQTGVSENGFTEILNAETLINKTFVTKGAYNLLMALKNVSEE